MTPSIHLLGTISAGSVREKLDLWLPHKIAGTAPPPLVEYPVDTELVRLKVRLFGHKIPIALRFVGTVSIYLGTSGGGG